ncbi:LOW QUALITY PROTEIN: synaptogyrin-1-like, partial [Discoglossus pictus]
VFSIVVFGCIVNEGYINPPSSEQEYCIFTGNRSACTYGVSVGVLAFLTAWPYLALDVHFPQISSVKDQQDRKKTVLSDMPSPFLVTTWAFFWFVGFCFLANQWQVSKPEDDPLKEGADAARAAIAFSFFSIFTWAGQAVLAFQRYRLGSDSALFSQDYMDPSQDQGPPYPPYASNDDLDPSAGYQQPPTDAYEAGSPGYQTQDY